MMQLPVENPDELMGWLLVPGAPPPKGITQEKTEVASWLFSRLLLEEPPFELSDGKMGAFEQIIREQFHRSPTRLVRYECPYPKVDFLRYLVYTKPYLLHGSNRRDIEFLAPREQTDWGGAQTIAVFATGDGIWPMFFALLNRSTWQGSIRNACLVVDRAPDRSERYYMFSVSRETLAAGAWSEGVVHVVSRTGFRPTGQGPVRFDEWANTEPVPIAAKIPVVPEDFPFLKNVTDHSQDEPSTETWLRFKDRQKADS